MVTGSFGVDGPASGCPVDAARGFPRQARLLSAAQYKQVFDQPGHRSVDRHFTVLAQANGLEHARLGLAISKKGLKKAVARNRVKRIVRESFRHHRAQLAGLDLVVINRNGVADAGNEDLFISLERHWSTVAARCKKS